jgi:hypothetical protein
MTGMGTANEQMAFSAHWALMRRMQMANGWSFDANGKWLVIWSFANGKWLVK